MGVSMTAGKGRADARASPHKTDTAKICFSPSESRCLPTSCPAASTSVIANDAGSMRMLCTSPAFRTKNRNDSVMNPDSRSIFRAVTRLRSTGDWLACDAGVGKALVRRCLAESEPRGPGRRLLFRATLCPGPYAVRHEPDGPGWQMIDTRTADAAERVAAAYDTEPAARLKANALNVRFQTDAAVAEAIDPAEPAAA